VDVPVSNTAIMADVLKKVSLGDIVTLLRLNAENMAIDELVLPEDSPAVGKRLVDLSLPPCAQVMAIVSKDGVIVPRGETTLSAGDELLILAQCEDEDALRKAFGVG
jgi:trk system potassium uptake protein TrkA